MIADPVTGAPTKVRHAIWHDVGPTTVVWPVRARVAWNMGQGPFRAFATATAHGCTVWHAAREAMDTRYNRVRVSSRCNEGSKYF